MKNNIKKITLCGVIAALITVICLAAYFPYLTYALPAIAGALTIIPLCEIGKKYAFFTYLASILPIFLFAENEAKLMYVFFFGYYPVLKALYESINSIVIEYLLKILTFNASVTLIYLVLAKLIGLPQVSFGKFAGYSVAALYVLANMVFILYDVCLNRLAVLYTVRFKKIFNKLFK